LKWTSDAENWFKVTPKRDLLKVTNIGLIANGTMKGRGGEKSLVELLCEQIGAAVSNAPVWNMIVKRYNDDAAYCAANPITIDFSAFDANMKILKQENCLQSDGCTLKPTATVPPAHAPMLTTMKIILSAAAINSNPTFLSQISKAHEFLISEIFLPALANCAIYDLEKKLRVEVKDRYDIRNAQYISKVFYLQVNLLELHHYW
jgi:hypothetical protein